MKITVVLCTYSRCHKLRMAMESIAVSAMPDSIEWEVLVVDNNSKDGTKEVVAEFVRRYPNRFRYLFEPKQGKSYALNSGIKAARGEMLAFVDDDVVVSPTWLYNLTAQLSEGNVSGTGGKVLLQEEVEAPEWLPLNGPFSLAGMLTLFDLGEQERKLDIPPFGTNMAFHRSVFEKYGGFRTDMGPSPGSEIRNEDTEFGRRLLLGGEKLWYAPSAVVYHEVPQNRLKKEYFLRFWYDHGRATVLEKGSLPNVLGMPRAWLTTVKLLLVVLPARTFHWLTALDPKRRFYFKGMVWSVLGQLAELRRRPSAKSREALVSRLGEIG